MESNWEADHNKADVQTEVEAEELEFLRMNMLGTPILQMTLMTTVELGVLDILVKGCKDAQSGMTADDVAAQITTQNPEVYINFGHCLYTLHWKYRASYN
jgi:Dimerisation domain